MSAQQLLVVLGFVSIGVLFAASIVAYLVTRLGTGPWRGDDDPGLPAGLLVSTLMLVGTSGAMHGAWTAIARNRQAALRQALWVALAFAAAFLAAQIANWIELARAQASVVRPTLFAFTFFLLTGLHAAHVLGGFVPLGIVIQRAHAREYSSSRRDGVRFCAWYWHYLGAIWVVLLVVLAVGA